MNRRELVSGLTRRALCLLLAGAVAAVARSADAQTMIEYSAEARFQLDVRVPDKALAAYLPPGWTPRDVTTRLVASGTYSSLFDGTEKVLSWDNILWINRTVPAP